nr:MAG TPA: hypothetical protein [Caudoviricetes sp.]
MTLESALVIGRSFLLSITCLRLQRFGRQHIRMTLTMHSGNRKRLFLNFLQGSQTK